MSRLDEVKARLKGDNFTKARHGDDWIYPTVDARDVEWLIARVERLEGAVMWNIDELKTFLPHLTGFQHSTIYEGIKFLRDKNLKALGEEEK